MNWAANKGGAKSSARAKIIVLGIGKKNSLYCVCFFVKEGSQKMFSVLRRSWAHPAPARLTLLSSTLAHGAWRVSGGEVRVCWE